MKTIQTLTIVLLATLAIAGTAFAYNGNGYYRHAQMQGGPMYQQLDQATQDKINTFWDSNQDLRKQMMMKVAEKQALLNTTNPDPTAVAKITGEIFDLQTTMRQKAEEAGVSGYLGRGSMGRGQMGCGYGRGGYGRRASW